MGYQALLFCPDDKLARVVSQVFTELDFTVDPVHEPFAAVKQLMAHRYDAVVVDCENEQNASLLFRSARNSNSNQNSLAIAVVEGQAGIAKAYRIGANLVLTKPINVEQAKGTLRVARGLLRKSSDASAAVPSMASPAIAGNATPEFSGGTLQWATGHGLAVAPEFAAHAHTESVTPASPAVSPAMTARTSVGTNVHETAPVHSPATPNRIRFASEARADAPQPAASSGISHGAIGNEAPGNAIRTGATRVATMSAPQPQRSPSAVASSLGSAAAPAPARQVTASPAKESNTVESDDAMPVIPLRSISPHAAATVLVPVSVPMLSSFGVLSEEESDGSGRNKKILIAAVVILALAALGYFTNGKLSKPGATPAPEAMTTSQGSGQSTARQMPAPVQLPATSEPDVTSSPASTSVRQTGTAARPDKPSPGLGNSPVTRIAANLGANAEPETEPETESQTKKSGPAPIVVTARPARIGTPPQAEEAAPPLPSTLTVAANNTNLSGLMSSASYNVEKPSLSTFKISQGVSQGLLIKQVQPKYPPAALATHTQGAVQIEATINKEGNVVNPKVLKGDPLLARAALEAVRQWRYKPYALDGEPVAIQTQITINFKAN
jgi:TonB family protein